MTTHFWKTILAALLLGLLAGRTVAAETVFFDSCFDGRGKTLRGVADTRQAELVRTIGQGNRREIHYNPDILPQLSSNVRYFLYAHQCARQSLHAGTAASTAQARQANCQPTGGNVLRLPLAAQPTARQVEWNACVRACADRLWTCQKSCEAATCGTCQATYEQCKTACGN